MSDAAEFFANKKKKKKTFKFNANKIDAAAVTTITHVDAPALSTDHDGSVGATISNISSLTLQEAKSNEGNLAEQWDDEALAATYTRKGASSTPSTTATLLDIKALDPKRGEQGDIAEKLRVEETKARLAAAREGMEREAQRIKEERERKEQGKREKEAAAASAYSSASSGGKWVISQRRSDGPASIVFGRMGSLRSKQELDVQDENLFPDLASADAILEQQQRQQQQQLSQKTPKKTPVGGGATWASRPTFKSAAALFKADLQESKPAETVAETVVETPVAKEEEQKVKESAETEDDTNPVGAKEETNATAEGIGEQGETAAPVAQPVEEASESKEEVAAAAKVAAKKKKKKKDLSTFGLSS